MLVIFKPILLAFVQTQAFKRLIVDLLKALVKQTDNTLDDQAVEFIEDRLWPNKSTKLQ
tara:strand:+ start:304 stop:480 length:177 start_codon:yes stop_codon:yes gene_type:complete